MTRRVKKSPAVLTVSRVTPPQAEVAREIDRVSNETGETVQSIMLKSVQCGLPEAEKILKQFQKGTQGK